MKLLRNLSVGFAAATTILTLAQGVALAAKPAATPRAVNSSAPCWTTKTSLGIVHVYVGSNGNCATTTSGGNLMAKVTVEQLTSSSWHITVEDTNCDNIGPYWKAHAADGSQYNAGDDNGCADGNTQFTVRRTDLATTPFNWWILWGGWNSPAFAFPTS